jgi:hypothetical protein
MDAENFENLRVAEVFKRFPDASWKTPGASLSQPLETAPAQLTSRTHKSVHMRFQNPQTHNSNMFHELHTTILM